MRVAIFAHYDRDCRIDDYVVHYLQSLRRLCGHIIFVSDCDLPAGQQARLEGLADTVIAGRHGEYDFGSYKRGFQYAVRHGLLGEASELIIANDSCYGPLVPMDEAFAVMDGRTADAWGMTINMWGLHKQRNMPHMQSFFIVLRPQVFNTPDFAEFMNSIRKMNSKHDIIRAYELGLSARLIAAGFTIDSYIPPKDILNPFQHGWRKMFRRWRVPLIKVSKIRTTPQAWRYYRIMSENGYPPELAAGHKKRICGLSRQERMWLAWHNLRAKMRDR